MQTNMIAQKHLGAPGKGVFSYDDKYDMLTFRTEGRNYKKSVEFRNFVADIDDQDFVTGVRILDASKALGLDKNALKNIIHMEFNSSVENNVITIRFKIVTKARNKQTPENFTQQLTQSAPMHLANSSVGPVEA